MPDINQGIYLIDWMGKLGWCDADGMGNLRAHSWLEMDAFARQFDVGQDDLCNLHAMSEAYIEGHHHGKTAMALAPVYDSRDDDPGIALERRLVSERIKTGLGGGKRASR